MEIIRTSDAGSLDAAARVLNAGGVVVIPTDTVYGLAAHPSFPAAVDRLYTIKGREAKKPIALLASDADAVRSFGCNVPAGLAKHWPGALTVVVNSEFGIRNSELRNNQSTNEPINQLTKTEGFRVPDHEWTRELLRRCGGVLRVTSANLSGQCAATDVPQALADVGLSADLVVDDGVSPGGVPSTVVKVRGDGAIEMLRQGTVLIDSENAARKAAVVGVVGRTNAGKSTIVNRLVGEKVSIVSPVEQTTRNTIRGIVEDPRGQLVLLDTPGLHKAVGPLGKLLNGMARASASGVDVLLVVFDASHEPQLEDEGWMRRVAKESPAKCVFALNKCDKSPFFETMFRDLWKEVSEGGTTCSPTWVTASAVRAGGCDRLMDALFDFAEPGPPLFPEDIVTDYPRKLAIADVVREKLIQRLHEEVPHEVGVVVSSLSEKKKDWEVDVTIYVNRPSQKGIVIGPGARLIKAVRQCSEIELCDMFGVRVHLELWVKVVPNWMKNNRLLSEMGYLGAEQ